MNDKFKNPDGTIKCGDSFPYTAPRTPVVSRDVAEAAEEYGGYPGAKKVLNRKPNPGTRPAAEEADGGRRSDFGIR